MIPVLAIPLILLALYEAYRYNQRKFVLQKRRVKKPPYSWPLKLEVFAPEIFESAQFYSAARRLQRRQTGEASHLDVEASVRATIDSLGYPRLQYKPNSKLPEYLVLIDRSSFRDHQAQLWCSLVARLRREGVFVTSHYFEGDPRVCFSDDGAATVYLSDLQTRYSQDRLLILGDGDQLIDPVNGKLVSWSALFRPWNDRAVLTPEVPARWGLREKALASQFIVLPATSEGFLALVDHFELAAPTDLRSWRKNATDLAPPDPDTAKLVEELRGYLGPGAFQWLCACAVYPELHWDLTLHLGSLTCLGENLIQEANLVKLVRLPWFRKGSMPDGLRSLLIQELKPAREQSVREAIISVLEKNPAPRETHASDAQNLEIATQRYWLNPRNRQARLNLINALQRAPEGGVARDYTLLSSLESTSRSPLDFLLPRTLRRALYPDGLSAFGPRTGARMLLTLVVILGGLLFVARNHKQQPEAAPSMPSPQEFSQLQNRETSEKTLFDQAKAAEDARDWDDAIALYIKVADLNGTMKDQALQAIPIVKQLQQGTDLSKIEKQTFQQAANALKKNEYAQARGFFQHVIDLNVPDSTLAPQAKDKIAEVDQILKAKVDFDAAQRTENAGDLKAALNQYNAIASGGGPFAAQAKARIPNLNEMINNGAAQQQFKDALQAENNGDLNGALTRFKALAEKGGLIGADAQNRILEIIGKLTDQEMKPKFEAALQAEHNNDLNGALNKYNEVAAKPSSYQDQAKSHIQQIKDQLAAAAQQQAQQQQAQQQFNAADQTYKNGDKKGALDKFKLLAGRPGPMQTQAQTRVDQITAELNAPPPSAAFGVVTKPSGVEVLIDGKSYGPSPVRATLPPGRHTYTVKPPGARPFEDTVILKSGNIITKTVTLPVRYPFVTPLYSGLPRPLNLPYHKGMTVADVNVDGGLKPTNLAMPPVQGAPPSSLVFIMIKIDENGGVTPERVLADTSGFGPQVQEAARAWKFNPPTAKGKPVNTTLTVKVTF